MSKETARQTSPRAEVHAPRFRAGALTVIALVAALILWLVLEDRSHSTSQSAASTQTAGSAAQLEEVAASIPHVVFWVGPKPGYSYELDQLKDGTVRVRYLPPGVKATDQASVLTVNTYPFLGAYAAIVSVTKQAGVVSVTVPHGGLGEFPKSFPQSVHVAYPGVDYQVEVVDPSPGAAEALVSSGQLVAIGSAKNSSRGPTGETLTELKTLPASVGHPVYWVGPRRGFTYEVTRKSSGEVDIRYLPPGIKVGASQPYLTLATYPFTGALQALKAVEKQENVVSIQLARGGLALLDRTRPTNIHLAYPGVDYQVEVYDPSPSLVRRLVTSDRVRAIG